MAKEARSGEMRTRIRIQEIDPGEDGRGIVDEDGYQVERWRDLFGGEAAYCKWQNPHGTDVYEAKRLNLREPVTITIRYSPKIHEMCRIFKGYAPTGDAQKDSAHAYEIISIDNIFEENKLLEIKAQRKVRA